MTLPSLYVLLTIQYSPALASQNLSRDFVNLPYLTFVTTASLHNRAGASSQLPFRDRLCPFHFLLSFEIVLSGLDFGLWILDFSFQPNR